MKKISKTLICMLVMLLVSVSSTNATADRQFSESTSYFGTGLSDSIVTATCSITAGSDIVLISCSTSASEIYDVMSYDMELLRWNGSQWTNVSVYSNQKNFVQYLFGSKTVTVASGLYKLRTYHYICLGGNDDDTYTTTQSVTVP